MILSVGVVNADVIEESGWKFRSDLQNSGVYDDGGDRPEALIIWTFFTGEDVFSSPVVANDTVYFGGDEDKIYALNADTGTQIWNFTTTGASWSSPAVTNGIIYYGGLSKFYALNATTGDFLWDFSSGQVESSPAVADGIVYFGSNNHKVYALFADNGTQVWSFSTGEAVQSSPAVVQNVVYIGSYDSKIYALNAVTGTKIWEFNTGSPIQSSPAVTNGIVYIGSWNGKIHAINADSGSEIWNFSASAQVDTSPAVANGVVFFGSRDHKVYAVNANTGTQIWSFDTGSMVLSSPSVANGVVYIAAVSKIYALNADTGTQIWSLTYGGGTSSSPAIANGLIYVGSQDNCLYAIGRAPPTPPANITNLHNTTYQQTRITWTWTDPADADFDHVMVYVDGVFQENVTAGEETFTATSLNPATEYTIGTRTVGTTGLINATWVNHTATTAPEPVIPVPPASVTNLHNTTTQQTSITWVWTDPADVDFDHVMVYLDGLFQENVTQGVQSFTAPGLSPATAYTIGIRTVGTTGLVNLTWVNHSATTAPESPVPVPPASVTNLLNTTYQQNSITWVWTDPADADFDHVMVYVNGVFQENVTAGEETFTATSLNPATEYTIGTRTVSTTGLINETWVNQTAWTKALSPVANFAANATLGQIPFVVQFTDNSTGDDITSRLWTFGDGGTSTELNPVHVYTTPGLFTVSLEVTNDGGSNSHTKTNYIRVFGTTSISDFIAEPQSGYAPLPVQFYDTSVGLPTGWQWDFGDGTTSHHQSPSHLYTNPGNYTVTLTTGSSGGTNTTVKTDFIQVIPESPVEAPVANFTADIWTGRFSAGADFYDASTGNPDSWNWSFGDGSYSNERNSWHEYVGVGSYDVTLTVSNSAGSDSITKEAFVSIPTPVPIADFYVAPRDRYGSFPLTVLFQDQSEGSVDWDTLPVTYEWDFGDGSPNSTERGDVYHHYMAAGTYTVTLTVTDIGGTDTMVRENYIGEAPPPQPIADFTATPKSGYAPLTVDFIDQSTGSPLLTYTWDLGDGNASYEKSPSHTYTQPGLYNISLITTNIGGSATLTKAGFIEVLSAHEKPPLHANFTSNITAGIMPVTIQFLDTSTGNPSAWSWVFEKDSYYPVGEVEVRRPVPVFGNELSHEKNPVVTYTYPGNYSVSLTVSRTGETDTITKDEYIRISPPAPEVDFSAYPPGGEAPLEVEFWENVPYAGYYDEFLWDFGDGTNGTGTWLYHTYENPGLYDVTLTVNSAYGSNSTTKTNFINVTRSEPPVPDFTGSPLSGNAPLDVVFTDTSTGMITTRLWDFGDGTTAWENGTAMVPHTYLIPGTYTITLTSGNDAGSNSITKAEYVHVNPSGTPPDARFILSPRMGNAPLAVQLTDRSSGMPLQWLWDFGDGTTSSEQNPSHTYTTPGRYLPRLMVYNSGGSDSSASFVWIRSMKPVFPTYTPSPTITVNPTIPPVPGKSPISFFAMNKSFGSAPMTVQFTDRSFNNPTSWQWDFGDGQTSTERNPVNAFTDPGTYSVSLNVKNAMGESTTSRTVYVR
jgi:PKD repeat protein/outer membrane protein assembly factor BamB